MKRKRYPEEQIISILKQHEGGRTMVDLARENGIAENTLYGSGKLTHPDSRNLPAYLRQPHYPIL